MMRALRRGFVGAVAGAAAAAVEVEVVVVAGELLGGTLIVTLLKYAISFLNCGQGRPPFFPIPREGVAANMSVRERGGMFDSDVGADVDVGTDAVIVHYS
jgi:hypothetical protein